LRASARQGSVLLIKRLGPTDVLPAVLPAPLPPKLQFKLGQAAGTGGMLSTAYDDLVEMNQGPSGALRPGHQPALVCAV
jgi:hypothetical protein